MTRARLYADVRQQIGGPHLNTITDADLEGYVQGALRWIAGELRLTVRAEPHAIGLVAEQAEYALPSDVAEMIDVEWNDTRLEPTSTYQETLDGGAWRFAEAANPTQYAILGRRLILIPPPSSDAVTTDGFLTIRYVAGPPEPVGPSGQPDLNPVDYDLLVYEAAYRYLLAHPGEESLARSGAYEKQIARLLPGARRRAQNMIRDFGPRLKGRSYREGAAR